MTWPVFGNRIAVGTTTTGTGTVTLGAEISDGFCTFAEGGIPNAAVVRYMITEGDDFEIGTGVYTTSGTTLTRATVEASKIGGTAGTSKMNLAGGAEVRVIASAEDMRTRGCVVDVFEASGTWPKRAGAAYVDAIVIGGGGGGGSGRRGANGAARRGGAGGGAGGVSTARYAASDLNSTETVTIGAGGAGAVAITANDTSGGTGSAGGTTTFGSKMKATGGAGGAGGTATIGTGGVGGIGTRTASYSTASANYTGSNRGAGSDADLTLTSEVFFFHAPLGGAGGAQLSAAETIIAYGYINYSNFTATTPPATVSGDGQNGSDGTIFEGYVCWGGTGGSVGKTMAAGKGGEGKRGSGGGGGGPSINGFNSGAGGDGGDGVVIVITYFGVEV